MPLAGTGLLFNYTFGIHQLGHMVLIGVRNTKSVGIAGRAQVGVRSLVKTKIGLGRWFIGMTRGWNHKPIATTPIARRV